MEPTLDVSGLVTLLDDRDPQALFDEWLAAMQTIDPGYVPLTGAVEVSAAEAMCLTVADLIYAVNRLPGLVTEAILTLTDIPRHPGAPTTGQVLFTFDGLRTVTIPMGTRMTIEGIDWQTTAAVTVTATTATVPVATLEPTGLGNSIPAGVGVDMLDQIPVVVAAVTTGTYGGGIEPESDASYRARSALIFSRSHSSLVLPSAFTSYAAGIVDVGRATSIDMWDVTGTGEGADPGHITVALWGYGQPIDETRLAQIAADIADRAQANLQVHVTGAEIVDVDIDLTVRLAPGADEATTLDAVAAAIRAAVSPMLWTWGETITPEEIAAIAARVAGVDYALDVTSPGEEGAELTPVQLPQVGALTVAAG